ncbi:MAG TPA: class I SAM-dependent methyltransferase [Pirellulales bacterium]|nr:class I SAM-dependent methyltransferase [Pirellulales bacterium]
MMPGPLIRRALGPAEHWVTGLYRRCFVDVRQFAADLASDLSPASILDVGCGEGQSTEALAEVFSKASIVGVDITPRVGRLFRGDNQRVRFIREDIGAFADQNKGTFDLAVLCDVLHHLPVDQRAGFLQNVASCMRPRGWLVVKEWQPRASLVHLLCYLGDRYLTGDRVRYADGVELRELLNGVPSLSVDHDTPVRPWRNNIAIWARFVHDRDEAEVRSIR